MKNIRLASVFVCILFFAYMLSASNAHYYKPQEYEQLKISKGKLHFGIPQPRHSAKIYLKQESKSFEISCQLTDTYGFGCGLNNKDRKLLKGKYATVRWQEFPGFHLTSKVLLYELEVDGEKVISYPKQLKQYSSASGFGFYVSLISFLVMLFICLGLFADKSNDSER